MVTELGWAHVTSGQTRSSRRQMPKLVPSTSGVPDWSPGEGAIQQALEMPGVERGDVGPHFAGTPSRRAEYVFTAEDDGRRIELAVIPEVMPEPVCPPTADSSAHDG